MHRPLVQAVLALASLGVMLVIPAGDGWAALYSFPDDVRSARSGAGEPVLSAVAKWRDKPSIIVCDSAPVSMSEVKKAVRWWQSHGHRFGEVHYKKAELSDWQSRVCRLDQPLGYILIRRGEGALFSELRARTHVHTNTRREHITWASIVLAGSSDSRRLEHQLGHALGYLDFHSVGHLMNPIGSQRGSQSAGLKRSEHSSLVGLNTSRAPASVVGHLGAWLRPPKVLLCEDAPVQKTQVDEVIAWWEERGHRVASVRTPWDDTTRAICANVWASFPVGYIVLALFVREAEREPDDVALALTYFHDSRQHARVFLRPGETDLNLLTHELGHAFGFGHTQQVGHLMHPKKSGGGWDDTDLSYKPDARRYLSLAR